MKNIILTGDRPTGRLHLGHYTGSLMNRVKIQDEGDYDKMFVFLADLQALTDNMKNPQLIKDNILEVMLDYLAVGLNPEKCTIFLQSQIPELTELTTYFMNLVSVSRVQKNPTVKKEIGLRGFNNDIPLGFFNYPVSQAADIAAFKANLVPAGVDQEPMIELTREIVRRFNNTYDQILVEPQILLPINLTAQRLPGIDGSEKMSKSLGNCIYLSDSADELWQKIKKMYTDPQHININDPGHLEGNTVFDYLNVFVGDDDKIDNFCSDFKTLRELKIAYTKGGVGDMKCKKLLYNVLNDLLAPIRTKRKDLENNKDELYKILKNGSEIARETAAQTIAEVRKAIGINY